MPTSSPGALMATEIAEQPDTLARLLAEGGDELARVRERILRAAPRMVLFAGRGTSDHAGLYGKYLVEVKWGRPAGLISPSTTTVYHSRPDLTGVLFLAVSQSGGSPDLIDSLTAAREGGALTVAVTNNPDSALAQAAEISVDVRAGAERAVAATKTYTAELLALHQLFTGDREAARWLPDAVARTLAGGGGIAAADRYRFAERVVTTGRGYGYPTAREAALKLMETSYLAAQAFSGADLLHGPLAMIDRSVPVLAVTGPGPGGRAMAPVLQRLAEAGADILEVGTAAGIPLADEGVADELRPILEILPLQQLAWRLALDRGGDPDAPRGLAKVTHSW